MTNVSPRWTALLGLLAVAGYQNRDKIAEILNNLSHGGTAAPGGAGGGSAAPASGSAGGLGGLLGSLTGSSGGGLGGLLSGLGGVGAGGLLGGGLGELVDQFTRNGQGQTVQSWVGTGTNAEIAPDQLEQAIGPDALNTLTQQTGMSRDELLSRLAKVLPEAVDKYTPDGSLPAESRT